MSTIASESVFSQGRQQLGDNRHSLGSNAINVLVYLSDWIRAERRNQGMEPEPSDELKLEEIMTSRENTAESSPMHGLKADAVTLSNKFFASVLSASVGYDPEIKFSCERCKVQVSIEKQVMLYNVPSVAIFHLKRFQNDGSVVRKVEKHVSFPLELDLLLYTDNNQTNNEQIKYDLYAVIVHVGSTSSSGHYYCFICAEPNEWYKFDDSMISRVHEDLVLAEKAYIMFYATRDTLRFLDFVALQMHNVGTIPKLSFSLPNHHASDVSESNAALQSTHLRPLQDQYFHELMKIVDNELKKTVQTSTPAPPSSINSSKENNASQDVGVIKRMAPLLPKSPSRSQSTLGKLIFNFYLLSVKPTNCFVYNIGRSGF
ncbi:putative glycine-rich cell wall structural protein 1.8-like [Capsicum annuum]|nr:putative glycine-rich cell wall structural protein 1.8-like [Capsicum annuum]